MDENKKLAGKDDLIQGIRLVCASDTKKTTIGRIRDIYDEIETLRMSGSSLATIHEGIVKGGFDLTLNALTVALHRIKSERKSQAVIPVLVGGNYVTGIVNEKKPSRRKKGSKKNSEIEVETPAVETPAVLANPEESSTDGGKLPLINNDKEGGAASERNNDLDSVKNAFKNKQDTSSYDVD